MIGAIQKNEKRSVALWLKSKERINPILLNVNAAQTLQAALLARHQSSSSTILFWFAQGCWVGRGTGARVP